MSNGLQIPEHLWKTLELMEQEMGVPKNNLVYQAIFTLARLNGYVVAGQVSFSGAPYPASETASRASAGGREKAHEAFLSEPVLGTSPSARIPVASRDDTPARGALSAPRENTPLSLRRAETPPHPSTLPPEPLTEEPPPHEIDEGAYAETEAEHDANAENELVPLTLYIEIPGEEPVPMDGDEFIIGRGKHCNFVIDSNRVSRQHARIVREGNDFVLEDLNSSNGTFYGKHREKVTRRVIVSEDEFIFGTERVVLYVQ